ncbi:V(D)J recombination-activating protein 1-like [Hydractinia symbiolongicarpus]|uniref:V(D)J recombination-activating protein 1-like n=1 Tax=Hydractinia symbiolongicarpus TaxID=13093 RepID=UPI00254C78FF|nr:V(D)J recombination-activating protein 1-like [Hydractinia symbiolongicarpus]
MADPESQHNIYLTKLCRICQEHTGKVLRNALSVKKFSERIEKAFRIDLKGDIPTLHPRKISLKCYSLMKNVETKNTTPILNVKSWFPHNSSDCVTFANWGLLNQEVEKKPNLKVWEDHRKMVVCGHDT